MSKELVNEFARWLERKGAQLKPVTSQWEVVRWSPQDSTMIHVMYLNKKEKESFSSDGARQVWVRFLEDDDDESSEARPDPRPVLKAPAAEQLIVQPVREVFLSTGADVHDEQGRWVATIHGVNGSGYKEIDSFVANCWLIGAAPQMLAALKEVQGTLAKCPDYDEFTNALQEQIQQAIDLATKGPQA